MESIISKLGSLGMPEEALEPLTFNNTLFLKLSGVTKCLCVFGSAYILVPYLHLYPRQKKDGRIQILTVSGRHNRMMIKWIKPQLPQKWCEAEENRSDIWIRASFVVKLLAHMSKTLIQDNATIELYNQFGFAEVLSGRTDLIAQIRKNTSQFCYSQTVSTLLGTRMVLYNPHDVWLNEEPLFHEQVVKPAPFYTAVVLRNGNVMNIIPRFPNRVF